MTVRAVVLGLLLGLGLTCFGWFNDWVLKQAYVASDLVPVSVFGLLVVGLAIASPLLRLLRLRLLSGSEWCVIISLMLVACVIPGAGLMWNFSNSLTMPHYWNAQRPGWRRAELLEYAPDLMLVDADAENQQRVVTTFYSGAGKQGLVDFDQVPWEAWQRTLSFWLPLIMLSFIAALAVVVVIHRQWAHRERLRYPVAEVAAELTRGAGEGVWPDVFRQKFFWLGFLPVFVILVVNGIAQYYPASLSIPLSVNLQPVLQKWPILNQAQHAASMAKPQLYFAVVGLAYFVSTEVSFSVGIAPLLFTAAFLGLMTGGVDVHNEYFGGGLPGFQLFGSYLGMGLIVLYLGRRFYADVAAAALGVHREEVPSSVAWAARIGLSVAAVMVLILVFILQLNWLLAILFVLLTGLLFLIVTRINVETGLFFIQPTWQAVGILLGMFGMAAVGPNMLITVGLLSLILTVDPRVCLMPLAANAMRFSEVRGVRPARLSWFLGVAVALALIAGVVFTLWMQYSYGGRLSGWPNSAAAMPFEMLQRNLGEHHEPGVQYPFQWSEIHPSRTFLLAAAVGAALVIGTGALRMRFTWWPIHPVLFAVWGTTPTFWLGPSFLLGWFLKGIINRLGGGAAYRRGKPLFLGLIAGEFAAGILWMIVGVLYYLHTGHSGPAIRVHP